MDEKNERIRELLKQLVELTESDDTEGKWYQKEGLSTEDIEDVKRFGEITGITGIQTKMLWYIMKCLDEIKDKLENTQTGTSPIPLSPICPYEPFEPYKSVPQPLGPSPSVPQVWYSVPSPDPSAPVTSEYCDTEGNKTTIRPMTFTCTYSMR